MREKYGKVDFIHTFTGIDGWVSSCRVGEFPNAADLKPQVQSREKRSHAVAAQETALMPAFGSRD